MNLQAGLVTVLKRLHYPVDAIWLCVRWYVAYSLSNAGSGLSDGCAQRIVSAVSMTGGAMSNQPNAAEAASFFIQVK